MKIILLRLLDFPLGFIFPVEYQEKPENHPAEVGKVGDSVVGSRDAIKQFEDAVKDDEPLGFHGEKEVDVYQCVWEYHPGGEQKSVDRAGRSHGNQTV